MSSGGEVYSHMAESREGRNLLSHPDYLETLVEPEARRQSAIRVFPSLLPAYTLPNSACEATSDGEFINIPPDKAFISKRKAENQDNATSSQQEADLKRFSFFSSALESTIYAADFSGLNLPGETAQGRFSFPKGESNGIWWLNMNNPTGEEIQIISKAFGIHPLTTEDIVTQETREKIELFPSYYFTCFRSFTSVDQLAGTDYTPFNIYVVVFREGTLSFSFAPDAHATRVRTRISNLKEYVSLSSDWICYALINDIVDSFAPVVSKLECEAEALEEERFIARHDDNLRFLQEISMARKNTTSLMRLLGGKADVLRGFTKRCTENYQVTPHMDIALYLGDIQDHVVTMTNSLIHVEEMLSRSHSNYLAQLSIDRITQGNQVNQFLTRVTVLATVLVPLVVITFIFGMNVKVPWEGGSNLNAWFGIVGSIIVFALACILIAKRMRYI
ncbi:uncharacterized protein B0J16DRAFT_199395 [Fusarium flagelliforme]|uniref:Cora-like mg2+ transporter n=1 Tax=Fusarium flagelliforme TaxID=2675880 RepID=A0A395MNK8_9HYPO|nr:uncharacterized protein B0J16DRAFT_199395 [Fusarium flagelliforme]KAH7173972.1 hypothetical protein B0J16DRAFT_199395 [Fusarium flagelliforme]RFN48973.1 cora-like mg2+ transporter [Fusarium flagelliforme]